MTALNQHKKPVTVPPAQTKIPYIMRENTNDNLETIKTEKENFDGVIYQPHKFDTKTNFFKNINMIWIPEEILIDMHAIAGLVKEEVSWLGTVDRDETGFTITEIFLPEQVVSGAETEMTNAGIAAIGQELIERSSDASLVNKLRFWCHTHPFGGTSPSGPDVTQTKKLLENVDDFFIRGICNKKGKLEFTLYLIEEGIQIIDCPWEQKIDYLESTLDNWLKKVNTSVKKKSYIDNSHYTGGLYRNSTFQNKIWDPKTFKWVEKEKEAWKIKYQCHLTHSELQAADDLEKKIGKRKGLPSLVTFFPKIKKISFLYDMPIIEALGVFETWAVNQTLYSDFTFEEFAKMFSDTGDYDYMY